MNREEIYEKLDGIFKMIFTEQITLCDDLSARDVEEWDSLAQVDLLVAIQDVFSVKIGLSETEKLKNVGEMVDLIMEKVS